MQVILFKAPMEEGPNVGEAQSETGQKRDHVEESNTQSTIL